MLIDSAKIREAKEKLGDEMAFIIARELGIEDFDEKNLKCCCPFHDEDTPSFIWNHKGLSFRCFGACGRSYDIIDVFIHKGMTYIEAVQKLFELAGVQYNFGEKGVKQSGFNYQYPKPDYADNKDKVYAYWQKRCISPKTIDYLDIRQDRDGNTLFQYYDLSDVLCMVKVRKSEPCKKNKIWHLPGADTCNILYNINKINAAQPLIICCGEGDCAALIECGFMNTVSINGGDQNTHWITECWDFLQQFNEIVLVHDTDKSGQAFVQNVSPRLGEYRVKVVDLPPIFQTGSGESVKIKDVNELLYYGGKEAVREAINNARDGEIAGLIDYTKVKRFNMHDVGGFKSGLKPLDDALGKFYLSSTNLITGIASAGKSSFISTLACRSIEQGYPVAIYSGELDNLQLRNWIDFVHAGQRGLQQYYDGDKPYYVIRNDVYEKINKCYEGQMYFFKDTYSQKTDDLLATAEAACRKYGVKTFFFDNLSSVDLACEKDDNKWAKQEDFIRKVVNFAKKWQVICFIVLHPRKLDTVRRMNLFDLQGVVAAANLTMRILALYRVQPKDREGLKPMKGSVVLDVLKDRYGGANGKEITLWYDEPSKRFYTDIETLDHRYQWDADTDYGNLPLPFGAPAMKNDLGEEVFAKIS